MPVPFRLQIYNTSQKQGCNSSLHSPHTGIERRNLYSLRLFLHNHKTADFGQTPTYGHRLQRQPDGMELLAASSLSPFFFILRFIKQKVTIEINFDGHLFTLGNRSIFLRKSLLRNSGKKRLRLFPFHNTTGNQPIQKRDPFSGYFRR